MKTLIFSIVLVLCTGLSQAQIIELEEARVTYNPVSLNTENGFSVTVPENYAGEFEKDPIAFMIKNFDIGKFISRMQSDGYNYYLVSFRSRKGELEAKFDESGNLLNTNQRFENIFLPKAIRHQLYLEYKGWEMVKNVHVASSWKGKVSKDFYRVTMKNGKETKHLKIDAQRELSNLIVSK